MRQITSKTNNVFQRLTASIVILREIMFECHAGFSEYIRYEQLQRTAALTEQLNVIQYFTE